MIRDLELWRSFRSKFFDLSLLLTLVLSGGERGMTDATIWTPGQDFSGARVNRASPPVQESSYSDAEDDEEKIEVVD